MEAENKRDPWKSFQGGAVVFLQEAPLKLAAEGVHLELLAVIGTYFCIPYHLDTHLTTYC